MKTRIAVLGSSNTDMVIRLEHLPRPGETLLGGSFSLSAGGKGANQAVAAARAGGEVTLIAKVGTDIFGDQAIAGFKQEGILTHAIRRDPRNPSGVALIFVDQAGQNCIAVAGGANSRLTPTDVRRARSAIAEADALVMQLETPLPTVIAAAQLAARAYTPVILNPAPATELPRELLNLVSILTPNETEAESLTGIRVHDIPSASRAGLALLKRGVTTTIITLGQLGAVIVHNQTSTHVPAFHVRAVDTVAAGDVFNGALAVALGQGNDLLQAVRFANAAASISVTRPGAQASAPRAREIEKTLKRAGHEKCKTHPPQKRSPLRAT
jgi:ribokinase